MVFVTSSAVARKIAQSCFISPFLTPIYSNFDSTTNNSSKSASMSKAEMIKDIETGEVVRHLDSNGTTAMTMTRQRPDSERMLQCRILQERHGS